MLAAVVLAAIWMMFFRGSRLPAAEARRLVDEGALLVDVRTRPEFASEHLPGAKNVPVHELSARLGEMGDKSRPVVLYCRSGARSARAALLLRAAGFEQVHDLGSIRNWQR